MAREEAGTWWSRRCARNPEIHRFQGQRGRIRAAGNGGAGRRSDARRVVPRGNPAGRVGQRCSGPRSGPGRDHRSALAAGERVGATGGGGEGDAGEVQPTAGSNQRSQTPARGQVAAAGGPEETATRKKQRRREAVISPFRWRVYRAREPSQGSPRSLR